MSGNMFLTASFLLEFFAKREAGKFRVEEITVSMKNERRWRVRQLVCNFKRCILKSDLVEISRTALLDAAMYGSEYF